MATTPSASNLGQRSSPDESPEVVLITQYSAGFPARGNMQLTNCSISPRVVFPIAIENGPASIWRFEVYDFKELTRPLADLRDDSCVENTFPASRRAWLRAHSM
jgi:hypothetical protein